MNSTATEESKRSDFKAILYELAKLDVSPDNPASSEPFFEKFESLYFDGMGKGTQFRHFYSDIFQALTNVNLGKTAGSIQMITENLATIRSLYRPSSPERDATLPLQKLSDHVNLDVARILYLESQDRKVSSEKSIHDLRAEIKSLTENINKVSAHLDQRVDEADKKLQNMNASIEDSKKEYIAILGIFSSVVLSFTAGIAFSTSVLQNFHKASVYRTVLIVILIGFVLLNIIHYLFRYVHSLVYKSSSDMHTFPSIKSLNIALIIMMLLVVIAWFFDIANLKKTLIHIQPIFNFL